MGEFGDGFGIYGIRGCIGLSDKNGGNKSEAKQVLIILLLRA